VNWIKDIISPATRSWEEFYRNRWHDKVIPALRRELHRRQLEHLRQAVTTPGNASARLSPFDGLLRTSRAAASEASHILGTSTARFA
jgi:hypothetical protein